MTLFQLQFLLWNENTWRLRKDIEGVGDDVFEYEWNDPVSLTMSTDVFFIYLMTLYHLHILNSMS
jgi:hypothetical protein